MFRDGHPPTKKARTNSNSAISSLLAQNSSATAAASNEFVPTFFKEISDIMRGFGDCEQPIKESVILVEKILLQQIRGILQEAIDISIARKGVAQPNQCDFEHLMRKHPVKIFRMQKYLKDMQIQKRIQDKLRKPEVDYQDDIDSNCDNSFEEPEREVPEKFDDEKIRRLFRADRISQTLDVSQYTRFNESRKTSFYCRHSKIMKTKFRLWLNIPPDVQISSHTSTILAYLTHETIATIVDFCILSRLNSGNRLTEPYSRVTTSGSSHNMLHLCPEVTQGRGSDGVKPITVQEINEALRRHTMMSTRNLGMFGNRKSNTIVPLLAV